jgi:hypothetical protein
VIKEFVLKMDALSIGKKEVSPQRKVPVVELNPVGPDS